VEGIVPKAAWHWGGDISVVNDPLEEPIECMTYVRVGLRVLPCIVAELLNLGLLSDVIE